VIELDAVAVVAAVESVSASNAVQGVPHFETFQEDGVFAVVYHSFWFPFLPPFSFVATHPQ
jgi:hypothetical protein